MRCVVVTATLFLLYNFGKGITRIPMLIYTFIHCGLGECLCGIRGIFPPIRMKTKYGE